MNGASPASYWESSALRLRPVIAPADRSKTVNAIFDNPHTNTMEDIEWIGAEFGTTEDDARRSFIEADFLFSIETSTGQPVYVVCVTPAAVTQTAMTPALEANVQGVTRLLRRLIKSEAGRVFEGTVTGCDVDDWRARWIRFMGFEDFAHIQPRNGKEMIVFKHKGRG